MNNWISLLTVVLSFFSSILVALIKRKSDNLSVQKGIAEKTFAILFELSQLVEPRQYSQELIQTLEKRLSLQDYQIHLHPDILKKMEQINNLMSILKNKQEKDHRSSKKLQNNYSSLRNMILVQYNEVRKTLGYPYKSAFESLSIRCGRMWAYIYSCVAILLAVEFSILLVLIPVWLQVVICIISGLVCFFLPIILRKRKDYLHKKEILGNQVPATKVTSTRKRHKK